MDRNSPRDYHDPRLPVLADYSSNPTYILLKLYPDSCSSWFRATDTPAYYAYFWDRWRIPAKHIFNAVAAEASRTLGLELWCEEYVNVLWLTMKADLVILVGHCRSHFALVVRFQYAVNT